MASIYSSTRCTLPAILKLLRLRTPSTVNTEPVPTLMGPFVGAGACMATGLLQCLIESTCLWRWREASGSDYACNSCDSVASKHGAGVTHTGGSAWSPSIAGGSGPPHAKRVRDVTKKEGTWHWKDGRNVIKSALPHLPHLFSFLHSCCMGRCCHSRSHPRCRECPLLTQYSPTAMITQINIRMGSWVSVGFLFLFC